MELFLRGGTGFFVPSVVADHLLGIASHDQLKVLLYVLAHTDTALTAEQIAAACKLTPDNAEEALSFWQDVNVLTVSRGAAAVTLCEAPVQQTAPVQEPETRTPEPAQPAKPAPPAVRKPPQADSSRFRLTSGELAERVSQNPEISDMFEQLQQLVENLTNTQMNSMIWMNEQLGLPPAVIVMLCSYCNEIGKFHPRYWEQIAVDWSDRGITSFAEADREIDRRKQAASYIGRLKSTFGLKAEQKPTANQLTYFESWQQHGYAEELVAYACEISRDRNNNEIKFPYIDKILTEWEKKGIRTVEAARQEGAEFAAKNAAQRSAAAPQNPVRKQPADVRIDGEPSIDLSKLSGFINQF